MQWFKHDSSANQDVKIKKLRHAHGLAGYGLYWYIIERIQGELSLTNTSLSLEDDAEVIAMDWGITEDKIQTIINTMLCLKLFCLNSEGRLTCPSMAKRLDASMTSNGEMRKLISVLKTEHNNSNPNSHGNIMIEPAPHHDAVMAISCKKEEIERKEQNIKDESVHARDNADDINTNHQPTQSKEVNHSDVFKRSLGNSASTVGGEVVPIQNMQGIKEALSANWVPEGSTTIRLQQKGIPLEFIEDTLEVFKSHYLETGQKFSSWQTKCFQWINSDWIKNGHNWKAKGQQDYRSAEATKSRLMDTSW